VKVPSSLVLGMTLVAVLLVSGCSVTHVGARACVGEFSADRCQALAVAAARELGAPIGTVTIQVEDNPNPDPGQVDFANRVFLGVRLADGAVRSVVIKCPGISGGFVPECMTDPAVPLVWPQPLLDFPGDATPFPEIDPLVARRAVPLRIPSLRIPIAGLGSQTIELGRAILPNGVLTESTFKLQDPWPDGVIFDGAIQLVAQPVGGGPPFTDQWVHGWHEGTEELEISVTFDVAWFRPGASFTLVDLAVG
jgi:hypothetical protein